MPLLKLIESRLWVECKIQRRRKFNDPTSQGINDDDIMVNGRLEPAKRKGSREIYVRNQTASALTSGKLYRWYKSG